MQTKIPYLVACFVLWHLLCIAQNETKKWYFGNQAGLDLVTNPPTILTNGALNTLEGCASRADAAGNLLFYTDGVTVWNSAHQVMANGNGLLGFASCTQSGMIIKKPGSNTIYYVISQGANTNGLNYSVVDLSLAAGMGSVTIKNSFIAANMSEKLTSVRHCNGVDLWLVSHTDTGTTYRSYLVTASGINTTAVTSIAGLSYHSNDLIGCLKLSPNGRKLAAARYSSGIEVYDFDNSTGQVSSPVYIPWGGYGVEFSPNGTKLYGANYNSDAVYQWDLCAGSPTAIIASQYTVCNGGAGKGQLQLAANGKIYIARFLQTDLAVIHQPNVAGSGCGYVEVGQSISPKTSLYGLPNMVTSDLRPPLAAFTHTVSAVSGCQTALFNTVYHSGGSSTGCQFTSYSITALQWDFGDPYSGAANSSTLSNPGHIYTSTGTYTVALILHYSCGGSADTLRQTVNVNTACLSVNGSPFTCAAAGSATVVPSGVGPFTYTWLPTHQGGSVASGLGQGTHTVIVHNLGNNATYTSSITFNSPSPLSAGVSSNSVTCYGASTASATVISLTGGSGSQTYLWSNGITTLLTDTAFMLSAGLWSVTVTDMNSLCTFRQQFTIAQPPAIMVMPSASQLFACEGANVVLNGNTTGGQPGYTYHWSTGVVGTTCTVTQAIAGNYIYTLSVTDANACTGSNTIAVGYVHPPVLSMNNVSVCPGQLATLTVSGAFSYTWESGVTGNTFTDMPTVSQQHTVTGTLQGCSIVDSAYIYVKPAPVPVIHSNSPVCKGDSLILICTGATAYSWYGPGNFTSSASSAIVFSASASVSGIYQVTVTAANSCTAATASTIVVLSPTLAVAPANPIICVGTGSVVLTATSNATMLNWIPDLNLSSTSAFTVVAYPAATQVYTITGSINDCSISTTIKVSVVPRPVISATSNVHHVLCPDEIFNLRGSGGSSYTWEYPNHLTAAGASVNVVPANGSYSGTYTLTALGTNGCSNTSTIHIPVEERPIGYLQSSFITGCVPLLDNYQFMVSNYSNQDVIINGWKINDKVVSYDDHFSYQFIDPGDYLIKGNINSPHGCNATVSLAVTVYPKPETDFSYSPEHPVEDLDNVRFVYSGNAAEGSAFSWCFIDNALKNQLTGLTSDYLFENAGTYPVALVVRNEWGCSDSIVKLITVDADLSMYVPNTFTPNEDGKNEHFYPVVRGAQSLRFSVFDRWGECVFSATAAEAGWDGNYKGEPCKEDVYSWKLEVAYGNNQVKKLNGLVTLVR